MITLLLSTLAGLGTAAPQDRVKIIFGTPLAGWPEMQEAMRQFEAEYPQIDVELRGISGDLGEGLVTLAVANELPDLFSMHHDILEGLLDHKLLADLEPFFARDDSVDTSDYVALDMGVPGIHALPLTTNSEYTIYNRSLFAEMGLPPISEKLGPYAKTWTPADFRDAAVKLTQDTNGDGEIHQWVFSGLGTLRRTNEGEAMYWPFGASLFDEADKPSVNTPEMVEALEYWSGLAKRGMTGLGGPTQDNPDWVSGNVGMGIQNRVHLVNTARAVQFDWALAPVPFKPGVRRATVGTGHYFAMSSQSAHKEEVWKLLSWITGPKGHRALAAKGLFPGQRHAFPIYREFWDKASDLNPPDHVELIWETTAYSRPPSIVGSGLTRAQVTPLLRRMVDGAVINQEISVQQGVTELQRQLKALQAEAKK